MLKTKITFTLLLAAMFLISACSGSKVPGRWELANIDAEANTGLVLLGINFVNDNVGWLNGWRDFYRKPPEGNGNGNGNRSRNANARKPGDKAELPANPNDGYVVLQTADGGKSWSEMPGLVKNRIRSVWFIAPQQGWALTVDRNIVRTTDGGVTWTLQRQANTVKATETNHPKGPAIDVPEQIEQIRFADNSHGWAWGGGKKVERELEGGKKITASHYPGIFLATLDGGQNWAQVSYPFERELTDIFFLNFRYGWACTPGGGFYSTSDGGLNWIKVETKLPQLLLRAIFFIDENNGWIVDGDGRIAKTTDSGRTWKKLFDIKDEFKMRDIFFTDRNHGWAVGDNGVILYTTDGEQTWLVADTSIPARLSELVFVSDRAGWAIAPTGVLLRYERDE